jgi:hypothetical protein
VKKLPRLILVFSLSFAVLFLVAAGMRFLAIRLEWLCALPRQQEAVLTELIAACRWALTFSVYGAMLAGLHCVVKEKVFAPAGLLCIAVLSAALVTGIGTLAKHWEKILPERTALQSAGGPGLILSNSPGLSGTAIVLLKGPAEADKARVVAVPGKPMVYQAELAGRDTARLPPVPFGDDSPWFLKSLAIDIRLNAENFQQRMNEGFAPFLLYVGALIFLLSSSLFIIKFSAWPLANLFLGCLAFRGVLALETFLNSPEMQIVIDSFLQSSLPVTLAAPLIFCGIGLLAHMYTFLMFLTKKQVRYGKE